MSVKTFGTYFSGGELFGMGAVAAGYAHAFGVEYDNDIADVARMNGFEITTADVRTIDPATLPTVTHFHASPSCVRASGANTSAELNEDGTKEAQEDIDSAEAVCRYLRHHKPETFSLENVYAYRKFKAFQNILKCLGELGYFYAFENVNSANFGVPQTRRRLILRASRVSMLRELEPTHNETGANGLPKWIGWYEAIEDLLDTLPESKFAEWQLARLPEFGGDTFFVSAMEQKSTIRDIRPNEKDSPASTVTSGDFRRPVSVPKAFLMQVQGDGGGRTPRAFIVNESSSMEIREATDPVASQVASDRNASQRAFIVSSIDATQRNQSEPANTLVNSGDGHSIPPRAWLSQGRVVSMTPRALARFQSLPDTYILPEKKSLACKIIGNGVPSLLAQRVMESMR